jgi:membrane protein DedA with SNARE-associated domain
MSPTFTGYFILDVLLLALVLLLPIPTTPFLIYLVINLSIIEFLFLYLLASNLYISFLYVSGSCLHKIRFREYLSRLNISPDNSKVLMLKKWRNSTYDLALEKLKEISIWNIIVIRTIGIHATLVAFGSGMVKARFLNNIIANSICAIIDVIFYWVLMGSGKIIINKIFPHLDIDFYLKEYFFQTITFSLILFYLIFFSIKAYNFYKNKQVNLKN